MIKRPLKGPVDRHIRAEGTIQGVPADGRLWLVVEVEGLKWPKNPVTVSGNTWNGEAYEGGDPPGGAFTLALYSIDSRGAGQIERWLEEGRRTDDYPGIAEIQGARLLDKVELKLRSGR